MIESCARCGAPASAMMSYHYGDRAVWLDDLIDRIEPGAGYAVCAMHGDRLVPPMGWTLTDRRNTVRLFAPSPMQAAGVA